MYISRDVVFHENHFPFVAASSPTEPPVAPPAPVIPHLHIPAHAHTRLALPSAASNLIPASSSLVSQSSSAEPGVTISDSSIPAPPSRIHPMRTKALNNIVQ
jgi:hypothetical protein